jgi:hypothetical protein
MLSMRMGSRLGPTSRVAPAQIPSEGGLPHWAPGFPGARLPVHAEALDAPTTKQVGTNSVRNRPTNARS